MKNNIQLYHREILEAIKQGAKEPTPRTGDGYIGTQKPYYSFSTPATPVNFSVRKNGWVRNLSSFLALYTTSLS